MSALWIILAYIAGWGTCWYFSRFLLRHVLRREPSLTADILAGLPQDRLLSVWEATDRELTKRRAPIPASGKDKP